MRVKTYSTVKAAKQLGVSRDTIYRWMRANNIQGARVTKVGEFQVRLWTEADLRKIQSWMKANPHANRGTRRKK